MTEEEREEQEREAKRRAERLNRIVSAWVAGATASAGLALLASMAWPDWRDAGVLQPSASFLLATGIVTASRALDGVVEGAGRRKPDERPSGSFLLLRLWLSCFAVIWAAITASQVLPALSTTVTAAAPTTINATVPPGATVHARTGARSSQVFVRLPADGTKAEAVAVRIGR